MWTIDHLIAQRMHLPPANNEFVGMTDYISECFHDLLVGDSEVISDSDSNRGSHHPSCECFMAETPVGHVTSVHEGEVTSPFDLNDEGEEDARVLPHP
jgi:hypothetical protein